MAVQNLFKTTVNPAGPLDGSQGQGANPPQISDFLTVQSLANFGAMTGAITASWGGLRRLNPETFGELWVPYAFAGAFAVVSLLMSLDAFKKGNKWDLGAVAGSIFVGLINALILASAVIGAGTMLGPG